MSQHIIELFLTEKERGGPYTGQPVTSRTIEIYRTCLRRTEEMLGKSLFDMTRYDAEEFIFQIRHLAPQTQNQYLAALRNFYRWAIDSGRFKGDYPFGAISARKGPRKLPYILSRTQLQKFIEELPNKKFVVLFSLMYFGGLRIGEAVSLKKDNVVETGLIINGKGDRMRHVPLPASMLENLKEYIENDVENTTPLVFVTDRDKRPLYNRNIYQVFNKAKVAAGLPDHVRAHNLRHTAATHFHQATGDIAATQRFLGHSSPTTTMLYAQISDQQVQDGSRKAFGD